jgi:hypothetical protein
MAEYEEPKKRIGLLQTNSIMIGVISPLHSQLQNHVQWASCRQPKNNPEKGQINRPRPINAISSRWITAQILAGHLSANRTNRASKGDR